MLPDLDRADAIGSYWGNPVTRAFAELPVLGVDLGQRGHQRIRQRPRLHRRRSSQYYVLPVLARDQRLVAHRRRLL